MDPISIAFSLAQFAPQVIRWISGSDKAGEAAEAVVGMAKAVTGRADPAEALSAIQADPSLALQFRQQVIATEADLDKAYLLDRQDARAMQVANKSAVPALLTAGIVGAFVSTLGVLMFIGVPDSNRDIIVYMCGQLSGGFGAALAFWFGTTRQSEIKTGLLANK